MKFQLCTRDEYGQSAILATKEDLNALIKDAKKEISSINLDNAFSLDDQMKTWETYFVEIMCGKDSFLYAGTDGHGKHLCYDKNFKSIELNDLKDSLLKFYIGSQNNKDIFAQNGRKKVISDIQDPELKGKTVYFIKKV